MADEEETGVDRAVRVGASIDWSELGLVDHNEHLHKPCMLRRRLKDGGLKETKLMLRMVTNPQRFKARTRSRAWAKELNLDLDRDKDLVDEMEQYEMLAFAIREFEAPYDQHVPAGKDLFRMYLLPELSEAWALHQQMVDVCDPRFGNLDSNDMWRVIATIAARGEPSFLSNMPGVEQATCIAFSAREACNSPNAPSFVRSLLTSSADS